MPAIVGPDILAGIVCVCCCTVVVCDPPANRSIVSAPFPPTILQGVPVVELPTDSGQVVVGGVRVPVQDR